MRLSWLVVLCVALSCTIGYSQSGKESRGKLPSGDRPPSKSTPRGATTQPDSSKQPKQTKRTSPLSLPEQPEPTIDGDSGTVVLNRHQPPDFLTDFQAEFVRESELPPGESHAHRSILAREFIRQAFLLGAREEAFLTTRDVVLQEVDPSDVPKNGFRLAISIRTKGKVDAELLQGSGKDQKSRHKLSWPVSGENVDYRDLIQRCEEWSRTVPALLTKSDLRPKTKAEEGKQAATTSSDEIVLNSFHDLALLSHVRALHHNQGLHPALEHTRLESLARAYSHLGRLTDWHWTAASSVYTARALLYAQRLVQQRPKSPRALRVRAYAFALAGLHAAALEDIKQADILQAAGPKAGDWDTSAPDWLAIIDAYCRYDLNKLKAMSVEANSSQQMAEFFHMLACYDCRNGKTAIPVLLAFLQKNPNCFYVYDLLASYGHIGLSNTVVATSITQLESGAFDSLFRIPGSPPGVPEKLATLVTKWDWKTAIDTLESPATRNQDKDELALRVFTKTLQQTLLQQSYRTALHLRNGLGVSNEHLVARTAKILPHHPQRFLVDSLSTGRPDQNGEEAASLLVNAMVYSDLRWSLLEPLMRLGQQVHHARMLLVEPLVIQQLDDTAVSRGGFLYRLADVREQQGSIAALMRSSPQSPAAAGYQVLTLKPGDPEVKALEKQFGGFPFYWYCVGMRAIQFRRSDILKVALDKYLALSPDYWGYVALADLHSRNGRERESIKALEQYLEQKDEYGLEQARVALRISRYFQKEDDWKTADRYAKLAAESGSAWGLIEAHKTSHALGNWAEAEQFIQTYSSRYTNGGQLRWYLWCLATGKGNRAAAQGLAEKALEERGSVEDPGYRFEYEGSLDHFRGEIASAAEYYNHLTEVPCVLTLTGRLLSIESDAGERLTSKDGVKFLEKFRQELASYRSRNADLAGSLTQLMNPPQGAGAIPEDLLTELINSWEASRDGMFDTKALDRAIADLPEEERPAANYVTGQLMHLYNAGPWEKYLKSASEASTADVRILLAAKADLGRFSNLTSKNVASASKGPQWQLGAKLDNDRWVQLQPLRLGQTYNITKIVRIGQDRDLILSSSAVFLAESSTDGKIIFSQQFPHELVDAVYDGELVWFTSKSADAKSADAKKRLYVFNPETTEIIGFKTPSEWPTQFERHAALAAEAVPAIAPLEPGSILLASSRLNGSLWRAKADFKSKKIDVTPLFKSNRPDTFKRTMDVLDMISAEQPDIKRGAGWYPELFVGHEGGESFYVMKILTNAVHSGYQFQVFNESFLPVTMGGGYSYGYTVRRRALPGWTARAWSEAKPPFLVHPTK